MAIVITQVLIEPELVEYLKTRNLTAQYRKSKQFLLSWAYKNIDLKLREPKEAGIWYFRINKQYRAHCTYRDNALRVYKIDDHSK
jgi:hypothetical protein